jgi:hypothetical protein
MREGTRLCVICTSRMTPCTTRPRYVHALKSMMRCVHPLTIHVCMQAKLAAKRKQPVAAESDESGPVEFPGTLDESELEPAGPPPTLPPSMNFGTPTRSGSVVGKRAGRAPEEQRPKRRASRMSDGQS